MRDQTLMTNLSCLPAKARMELFEFISKSTHLDSTPDEVFECLLTSAHLHSISERTTVS